MRQIDTVVLIVSIILLYIQPYVLIRSMNTFIGRLVSIIILVLASLYSTLSGIVLAMVMVVFTDTIYDTIYEGMSVDAEAREKAEVHAKAHAGANNVGVENTSVSNELLNSNYDINFGSQIYNIFPINGIL